MGTKKKTARPRARKTASTAASTPEPAVETPARKLLPVKASKTGNARLDRAVNAGLDGIRTVAGFEHHGAGVLLALLHEVAAKDPADVQQAARRANDSAAEVVRRHPRAAALQRRFRDALVAIAGVKGKADQLGI